MAILMSALLLSIAYKIDVFSVPIPISNIVLPPRDVGLVFTVITSLTAGILIDVFLAYRLGRDIRSTLSEAKDFTPKPPSGTPMEVRSSLLDKVIKIERTLRSLTKIERPVSTRELISQLRKTEGVHPQLLRAIESVWDARNAVLHGVDLPYEDIVSADELAQYVLSSLDRLASRSG